MAVVALAYDEHDVRRAERAGVYLHFACRAYKSVDLFRRERVGVYAEHESVYRLVEHGVVFLGEGVLNFADCGARHQFVRGSLVMRTRANRPYE